MKSKYFWLFACALVPINLAQSQPAHTTTASAAHVPQTQTREIQTKTTPAMALQELKDGNVRYTSGKMFKRDLRTQAAAVAEGQFPFATVLCCIDSRTTPELVFDQGFGDIFVARVAGNVVDDDVLGSLEYACEEAGSKVVVVLGHTGCGAVKGACDDIRMGNLTMLVARIRPAVDSIPNNGSDRSSKNHEFVDKVSAANVQNSVEQIRERSTILREMADKGEIKIVGAMLDLHTGVITYYDTP